MANTAITAKKSAYSNTSRTPQQQGALMELFTEIAEQYINEKASRE